MRMWSCLFQFILFLWGGWLFFHWELLRFVQLAGTFCWGGQQISLICLVSTWFWYHNPKLLSAFVIVFVELLELISWILIPVVYGPSLFQPIFHRCTDEISSTRIELLVFPFQFDCTISPYRWGLLTRRRWVFLSTWDRLPARLKMRRIEWRWGFRSRNKQELELRSLVAWFGRNLFAVPFPNAKERLSSQEFVGFWSALTCLKRISIHNWSCP